MEHTLPQGTLWLVHTVLKQCLALQLKRANEDTKFHFLVMQF